MSNTNDVRVRLTADPKSLKKGVDSGTKSIKGLGNQASLTSSKLIKLGAGFVSFAVILNQAKKGFADLISETEGLSKVNSVLTSTAGVAGITADQIENLTLEMQKTTKTSQDAAREVAALGLTFTSINKDVFPEYMTLANDMATITGGDMASSALQLGKALQDPILGASSLSRVGVNLTKVQKDQIKTFQKSGQIMKAQHVILKELRKEFGGAAKAVGASFFGTVKRAANAVDDFRKAFIKGLGAGAFGGVRKLFEYIIDNQVVIGENFRKIGYIFTHNFILDAIIATGKLLKFSFDGWKEIGKLWEDIFGDSFFGTVVKGWKMIFKLVENMGNILPLLAEDFESVFEKAINNIGIRLKIMFNEAKAAMPFSDFDAGAQNKELAKGFTSLFNSKTTSALEKMNADIFAISSGQDIRQRDADFEFSKASFNLAGGTSANLASGLLGGSAGGVDGVGGKTKNGFVAGQIESATGTAEDEFFANRMKQQSLHNALVLEQREADRVAAIELQQAYYDGTTSIIVDSENAMLSTIEFFADQSIATFTSMSTSVISSMSSVLRSIGEMGGGGGLFGQGSSILGGLGILGAGISLVGAASGALFSSEEDSNTATSTAAIATGAASKPSAQITKTGPDTVNYYINNENNVGAIVGEFGIKEFAQIITGEQRTLSASAI